ncbi:hypothetical protein EV421DRAFT_1733124 [Armillaria borealis]|uniref:Uncharacterized protein n=1 Tax=Armillaria borealis TaxID=47425 RepID=A0AA39MW25_9AGAR|nr:hypothetical protein EV421DRAFT_1733124 [Armillaria borealis]
MSQLFSLPPPVLSFLRILSLFLALHLIPKGEAWKIVHLQIALALMKLLKKVDGYNAMKIYQDEQHHFAKLSKKHNRISKLQSKAGTTFLDYFDSYISLQSYWKFWSPAGAKKAAIMFDILVNQVMPDFFHKVADKKANRDYITSLQILASKISTTVIDFKLQDKSDGRMASRGGGA